MRTEDEGKHPEAIARERAEELSWKVGYGLMGSGVVVVLIPLLLTADHDLELLPAIVGLALVICGGVLRDPKTWKAIAFRGIDAIPGGKN